MQAVSSFHRSPADEMDATRLSTSVHRQSKELPMVPIKAEAEGPERSHDTKSQHHIKIHYVLYVIESLERSPTLPIRPIQFRGPVDDLDDTQEEQDAGHDAQGDEDEEDDERSNDEEEEEEDPDRVFFDAQVENPSNCQCIVGHRGKSSSCTCCGSWVYDIKMHLQGKVEDYEYNLAPIDESDIAMLYFHSSKDCDCQLPDGLGNPRSEWKTWLDNEYVFQDRNDDDYDEEEGSQRD
ncbi:hypothetical protein BU16DRAFT_557446 [Lophium mytilinum]|uniref:Uncharacterized protein n=1 Tax=Lophium mytilinum TaxID=390894 RepID=A0A6A6R450_9PEZI|nr:hypothetical protein BU16DRAFT_557446 [Lophium mytilinum]